MRNNEQMLKKKAKEKHSNEQMQIKVHAAMHEQMQRKKAMQSNGQVRKKQMHSKQGESIPQGGEQQDNC